MDANTLLALAKSAVTLISPYIATTAKEFAKEAGKGAARLVPKLYDRVKAALGKTAEGAGALQELEAKPGSKLTAGKVAECLANAMHDDPALVSEIKQIIEETEKIDGLSVTAIGIGNFAAGKDIQGNTVTYGNYGKVER